MIYADYTFYKSGYHGTEIDEVAFPSLAARASAFLDYFTLGKSRLNEDMEAVKMACCALAEKYSEIESLSVAAKKSVAESISSGKKSESVGSYSVTYQTAGELKDMVSVAKSELAEICRFYLAGTNLLYRGGCGSVHTSYCNRL